MFGVDNLFEQIERGREGKNIGLSTGMPKWIVIQAVYKRAAIP